MKKRRNLLMFEDRTSTVINIDNIIEETGDAGVTIEGTQFIDGEISAACSNPFLPENNTAGRIYSD